MRDEVPELGTTVGAALLAPHRSYLPLLRPLLRDDVIKGMAHITGGGITDNLPRVLPSGTEAVVRLGTWDVPAVFRWLERAGAVPKPDMLRTFNMGIGLVLVVAAEDPDRVIAQLRDAGEPDARVIGEIPPGCASSGLLRRLSRPRGWGARCRGLGSDPNPVSHCSTWGQTPILLRNAAPGVRPQF